MANRRYFLKTAGLIVAGAGLTACQQPNMQADKLADSVQTADKTQNPKHAGVDANASKNCFADSRYAFFGEHQAGITTPAQRHNYFLVLDLHSRDVKAIAQMFQDWTVFAQQLMNGNNIKPYAPNKQVPPTDTGEADSLGAYGLTLTFGIAPSFLTKLGLDNKKPAEFVDLPHFAKDQIRPELSGGDICIQACSEDMQVAFHAVRQLVRQSRGEVSPRWSQAGFVSFDTGSQTPRNLFAFKDGTANELTLAQPKQNLWITDSNPAWLQGGTYLVVRLIQMHLETWDRTSLKGQEETFARHRHTGAPLGSDDEFDVFNPHAKTADGKAIMPEDAHTTLANQTGLHILRRSYSYSSGIDIKTGAFNAGLLFISFQKSPTQFIAIQNALGRMDKMNEYITHIGSGLFACFGGVKEGEYLGQALFEGAV